MAVRIPIQADGGQVAKVFEEIRKAMERSGQAGRELSKIDLSHPELKEHAEDLRKVIAHYDELKKVWRQLGVRTKATGQGGAAPWDLDLARMYPTSGQAARARETLGHRLLSGTSWGSRLPPPGGGGVPGAPPGGGGIPGLGLPGIGGLLKFTLGLAGLGSIASMAKRGVGQAQQEAVALDPLWRRLQETAGSFEELRERTRDLGRGLGVTYEKSVQLGSEFARLSADSNADLVARGTRTGIGLARGIGMQPDAVVDFMGRSRFKGAFSGGEERRFASMIAAGVRAGGMQAAPEKVVQAVDQLTDSLVRRGVNARDQVGDMLGVMAMLNKSGNPALRGEYGTSIMSQIAQGMVSPGSGAAGKLFNYQSLGVDDPFEAAMMAEQGPLARLKDGTLAIESIFKNLRKVVPGGQYQRAEAFANTYGTSITNAKALDELFEKAAAKGIEVMRSDVLKIAPELGGNQGADMLRLMTGVHNALTVAGGPLLLPVSNIASAVDYIAGMFGYKAPQPPPEASGEIERRGRADNLAPTRRRIQDAIAKEAAGDPKMAALLDETLRLESNYSPRAGLGTGHVGVGQLSADTARRFGMDPSERTDIEKSVHAAHEYLKFNLKKFGRYDLAGGAYVSGEGNMEKYLAGESSEVGPQTLARMNKIRQLGLDDPASPAVRGGFDLNVTVAVPGVGKTTRTVPVQISTPTPNGTAAVSVP